MFASIVISAFLVAILLLIVNIKNRTQNHETLTLRTAFGDKGLEMFLTCILLLWILPYGVILILPLALLLSILSPAGRQSWHDFGKIRSYAIASMLVVLLLGGLVPTSNPKAPQDWGEPLFYENPNAPLYPSGKQYTWLNLPTDGGLNVEIIQSLSIRTPHQFGKLSAASSTLNIADLFDLQQSRLNQAVQLLDDEIILDIDKDEMKLVPIKDKDTHTYDSGSELHELEIRLYELRSLTITTNPSGVKVGEVFCAAESSWGGELNVLVVVRPVGHTGLISDRYAESLAVPWILAS